jgi:hypothetical protein
MQKFYNLTERADIGFQEIQINQRNRTNRTDRLSLLIQ